jgi:hypothetical protein
MSVTFKTIFPEDFVLSFPFLPDLPVDTEAFDILFSEF